MSSITSYKTTAFKESQKFLVIDPSTQSPSLVLGSDLVSYITPMLNYVRADSTRLSAENTDYDVGTLVQTSGATSPGDNFAATYLVVEGGTGDFPMLNGNDLLVIKGDEFLREQLISSDAGEGSDLVAHTGTSDTVTEALDKRTIYVGSVAELEALSLAQGVNVYLTEDGRAGEFSVKTGTPPSDPQKGRYIVLANGNYAERVLTDNYVHVNWYGAVGDYNGTTGTLNTAAIQAAFDTGLPVKGDKGKRYLTGPITRSAASAVFVWDLDLALDNAATSHCLHISNAVGGIIRNVNTYIDPLAVAAADASGLFLDSATSADIQSCKFDGGKNDNYGTGAFHGPLFVFNSTDISVEGCEILGGDKENFYFDLCFYSRCINTYSHDPINNSCIGTSRGGYNSIVGCVAENSQTSAISINGIHNTVTGCVVRGTNAALSAGINVGHPSLYQADYSVVTGNTIEGAVEAGVAVTGCGNVVVSSNVIRSLSGGTKYGVFAANGPGDVTITDNECVGTFEQTIRYFDNVGADAVVKVQGNKGDGATSSSIFVRGAGTVDIQGNTLKNPNLGSSASFVAFVALSDCELARVSSNTFVNDQGGGFGPEYYIYAPGSTDISKLDVDNNYFRGSLVGLFNITTSAIEKYTGNNLSDDLYVSGVSASAGTTQTVVTNGNVIGGFTVPVVIGGSGAASALQPYISSILDGSFTIGHNTAAGGEFFRWSIH